MKIKVVAKQGEQTLLLSVDDIAFVVDFDETSLRGPYPLDSMLARGYWEPVDTTSYDVDEILRRVDRSRDDLKIPERNIDVDSSLLLDTRRQTLRFPPKENGK